MRKFFPYLMMIVACVAAVGTTEKQNRELQKANADLQHKIDIMKLQSNNTYAAYEHDLAQLRQLAGK